MRRLIKIADGYYYEPNFRKTPYRRGEVTPIDKYGIVKKWALFILLLISLFFYSGCAIYFAVEFDTCSKCTKIVKCECPNDTTDVWDYYGGGY